MRRLDRRHRRANQFSVSKKEQRGCSCADGRRSKVGGSRRRQPRRASRRRASSPFAAPGVSSVLAMAWAGSSVAFNRLAPMPPRQARAIIWAISASWRFRRGAPGSRRSGSWRGSQDARGGAHGRRPGKKVTVAPSDASISSAPSWSAIRPASACESRRRRASYSLITLPRQYAGDRARQRLAPRREGKTKQRARAPPK